MSLDVRQLLERVVRPALTGLGPGMASEAAIRLVLGTGAVESGYRALAQYGGGPALGLWQMEAATHRDIWTNFLAHRPALRGRVLALAGTTTPPPADLLIYHLRYAAALCRVHYLRDPAPLPDPHNLRALAETWKRHYNTRLGAGTIAQFEAAWFRLVRPILQ